MLLREEFRRRHHDGLRAGFHRLQNRPECDRGLAAANVADEYSIHLARRLEVGRDLIERAILRGGQAEWNRLDELLRQLARPSKLQPWATRGSLAFDTHRQLECEQFIER